MILPQMKFEIFWVNFGAWNFIDQCGQPISYKKSRYCIYIPLKKLIYLTPLLIPCI
jgi:hypothetical protein